MYGPLPGLERAPAHWTGPLPELYVEKGAERIAFLSHAQKPYLTEADRTEILQALKNPDVHICLVAPDISCERAAEFLIRSLPRDAFHRFRLFVPGGDGGPFQALGSECSH